MATRDGIGVALEGEERFDAISQEIEEKFSSFHSLLETRRSVLLERVKKMRELYRKHRDLDKAIEQLEGIRRATNEMLTENLVVGTKEESVNLWDDKIRDLKASKEELEAVSNLKFVVNSEEFTNCMGRIHLREIEAVEYSKRREPLVMKVNQGFGIGKLFLPHGISIDDTISEVFVAEVGMSSKISVYSSEGEFIRSFGSEELKQPHGICVSGDFVFVTDNANSSVVKFTKTGEFVKRTNIQDENVQLMTPLGLCVLRECLYVCSSDNNTIEVLDLDLVFVKRFGEGKLNNPYDIKTLNNQIFVLTSSDTVHTFNSEHNYLHSISLTGQTQKIQALFFTVDRRGNFIFSDLSENCLKVFSSSGEYIDTLGDGFLLFPFGIATDNKQHIIVVCQSETIRLQVY